MTHLQDVTNPFLQDRMPINVPRPSELCPVLVPEVHPDEVVFAPRELTNDTVGLSEIRSFEHHPRRREGNVVTQECSSRTHLACDGVESCAFRRQHNPIDTLGDRFALWSTLQLFDKVLQCLRDGMVWVGRIIVLLESPTQRRQAIRVDVNDIANVQEVVAKEGLELKGDLPIGLAEKFRQTIQLGLREEVARLDFDVHLCRTSQAGPLTEVLDFETSFVFVEVENDLMNVWGHTSVGRVQGAETFAVLLYSWITVVVFLLKEWRRM